MFLNFSWVLGHSFLLSLPSLTLSLLLVLFSFIFPFSFPSSFKTPLLHIILCLFHLCSDTQSSSCNITLSTLQPSFPLSFHNIHSCSSFHSLALSTFTHSFLFTSSCSFLHNTTPYFFFIFFYSTAASPKRQLTRQDGNSTETRCPSRHSHQGTQTAQQIQRKTVALHPTHPQWSKETYQGVTHRLCRAWMGPRGTLKKKTKKKTVMAICIPQPCPVVLLFVFFVLFPCLLYRPNHSPFKPWPPADVFYFSCSLVGLPVRVCVRRSPDSTGRIPGSARHGRIGLWWGKEERTHWWRDAAPARSHR